MSPETHKAGSIRGLISFVLGLTLLLAALLKGHDILTRPAVDGWTGSVVPRAAVVLVEVGLGLFLASGLAPCVARVLGAGTFVFLSLFALGRAVAGAESCGCFGQVSLDPWLVFGVDLAAAALLITMPVPPGAADGRSARQGFLPASAAAALALSAGLLIVWWRPVSSLTDEGDVEGDGRLVAVDPSSWPRKRFPLLGHIDHGDKLAKGCWIVMLHRDNCPGCREALPAYVGLAHDLARGGSGCGVALIEIPPGKEDSFQPAGSACLRGRLSDAHHWEVRTPLFLSLNAGVVEEVSSDPDLLLEKGRGGRAQAAPERAGLLGFPDYRQARRNRYLGEIACGPLSLLAVFRSLGLTLPPDKEEKLIAEAGDRGIDLLRLKELAEGEGVHALGVKLTGSDLARLGLPAVVHDGRFGFAAVTGSSSDGVRIVRPFKPVVVYTPAELAKHYGSSIAALLLSRHPIEPGRLGSVRADQEKVRGPWLRPERSVVSVGRVYKKAWEGTLKVRNAGDAPLRIWSVRVGHREVNASVNASVLQPGEVATLWVSGGQEEIGPFTCAVEIGTNETFRKSVEIPVRGYAEQAVWLEQSAAVLDRVYPGHEARAEVKLGVADGFLPDKVRVRIPEGAPLVGRVGPGRDGSPCLHLTWRGVATPGWHRYTVHVEPSQAEGYLPTPLPVAIHVVPAVEVFPESLWLRDVELAGAWSRRLTVRLLRPQEPRAIIADEDIARCLQVRVSSNGGGEHQVTLGPRWKARWPPSRGEAPIWN